jgi:hypothetical protein
MSNRPLKVFISSTSVDLQEHRQAVSDVIRRAGEYDIDMRYFGSRPDNPVAVCREAIEEADVLIGIYAWRYGWIPDGETRSITEMEFDYARSLGKDCLCYFVNEDHPWPRKFVETGAGEQKLADFKRKVSELVRDTFDFPDNLAMKVSSALTNIIKKRERSVAEKPAAPTQARKKTGKSIPDWYALTCNRVEQADLFMPVFFPEDDDQPPPPMHLFFYLYGDAKQAHKSLAKRFGHEVAGQYFHWEENPAGETDRPTKKWTMRKVKPQLSSQLNMNRINLFKELYKEFGLDLSAPMSQRRVVDLYKSPVLQHFTANDTVVVILTMDEKNWHPEHTPAVVRQFVTEYFQCECPPDSPRIMFFFGIEYGKDKTEKREQVKKAIDESEHGIRLPELKPVTESDVEEWFSREDRLLEEGTDDKYMRLICFGDFDAMDMADAETYLKKIIEKFNENEC